MKSNEQLNELFDSVMAGRTARLLNDLEGSEKVNLAAMLTQAVMSHCAYSASPTTFNDLLSSVDGTYMVFGRLLNMIVAGQLPEQFPKQG